MKEEKAGQKTEGGMMKWSPLHSAFLLLTFGTPRSFDDRDKDGGKLVAFGAERLQLCRFHDFALDQQSSSQ